MTPRKWFRDDAQEDALETKRVQFQNFDANTSNMPTLFAATSISILNLSECRQPITLSLFKFLVSEELRSNTE